MSINSTKTLQGIITPSMTFQTEKEDVFTFRNSSNIVDAGLDISF